MPTFEDYRQTADWAAQLAIACSAPSIAGALLALAVEYMALADRLGQSAVAKEQQLQMQQDPAASETSGRQAVNSFRRARLRREGVEDNSTLIAMMQAANLREGNNVSACEG
jgi:hypothetical protein